MKHQCEKHDKTEMAVMQYQYEKHVRLYSQVVTTLQLQEPILLRESKKALISTPQ